MSQVRLALALVLVRDIRRFERLLRDAHVEASRIQVIVTPCAVHNEAA
jgi:hypothetical protein